MFPFFSRSANDVCVTQASVVSLHTSPISTAGSRTANSGLCEGGLVSPAARQRAEDDVPQRGGDAKTVAVILEVVAHVLLSQPLAEVQIGRASCRERV